MELVGYREQLEELQRRFPEQSFLTVKECADFLGVGLTTVYARIEYAKNPIPVVRVGRCIRISLPALARWLCSKGGSVYGFGS